MIRALLHVSTQRTRQGWRLSWEGLVRESLLHIIQLSTVAYVRVREFSAYLGCERSHSQVSNVMGKRG